MAIRIEQSGALAPLAGLATLAGESVAAQKQEEYLQRAASEARQFVFQKELRELDHMWDVEAYNRSKAWEIEKAQLASQMDFAREERNRQQEQDKLDTALRSIDSAVAKGYYSDEEAEGLRLQVQAQHAGASLPPSGLFPKETTEKPIPISDIVKGMEFGAIPLQQGQQMIQERLRQEQTKDVGGEETTFVEANGQKYVQDIRTGDLIPISSERAPEALLKATALQTPPKSQAEFERMVQHLKAVDPETAIDYWNTFGRMFGARPYSELAAARKGRDIATTRKQIPAQALSRTITDLSLYGGM